MVPHKDTDSSKTVPNRESNVRSRPLSVSGIPSPSPKQMTSVSVRRDKYNTIAGKDHLLRRTTSVRSVSSKSEGHVKSEPTLVRTNVPPRKTSQRSPQSSQAILSSPVPTSKNSRTPSMPPSPKPPNSPKSKSAITELSLKPSKSQLSNPAQMSPNSSKPHKTSSMNDPVLNSKPLKPQTSKDLQIPSKPMPNQAKSKQVPSSDKAKYPLNSNKLPNEPKDLLTSRSISRSPKSHPSKDSLTSNKNPPLRTQRSIDLSPTPSQLSSPISKSRPQSTPNHPNDLTCDQIRLLQLIHLVPLSHRKLEIYESTAHSTLSERYSSLQTRFFENQRYDHATTLLDNLAILKCWSDTHIRVLSSVLLDWESLTGDLKAFCKRLVTTIKPVNKGVLEEKGPYAKVSSKLTLDRLFSRMHGIEVSISSLPAARDGVPGEILHEIKSHLPLLREEIEMSIVIAGLKWRSEVLQTEMKRMEVVKRMSLGKPGQETICAWRE